MKVLGIIVEYNPFHNGHLHHLKSAIEIVNPDYVVAVMSGSFTQRGEPTVIDKFSRAEIALKMGVDVVIELPFLFAIQDAGGFAYGAVGLLYRSGVVTDVVFGSESNDREFIEKVAEVLYRQPWRYQEILHFKLKKGLSFPNARKEALIEYFRETGELDEDKVKNIENSNDILGVEYVRSIKRYGANINFHTIKRVGARYREESFKGRFSSATSIRKLIKDSKWDLIKDAVPEVSYEIIKREIEEGRGPIFWEDMDRVFLSRFRLMDRKDFERIYGFVEGLDKRFEEFSKSSSDIQEFVDNVKTKRFTFTRIRRLMLYALFGIEKDFMNRVNDAGPLYLRVLGFTGKGRELLSVMKKKAMVPIVTTPSLYKKALQKMEDFLFDEELYNEMFEFDVKATNLYSLFYPDKRMRSGIIDYKRRIIIL